MTQPSGPRILFKTDEQSSVGRGAVTYAAHFRPEVAIILYHAARTAPRGVETIIVSEAWRDVRDRRDLHEESRAFDFSTDTLGQGFNAQRDAAEAWAGRLAAVLGPDYDVLAHGENANLHIHVELDP